VKVGDLIRMKPCNCCAGRPDDDALGIIITQDTVTEYIPSAFVWWVLWSDIGLDYIMPKDKHFEVISENR